MARSVVLFIICFNLMFASDVENIDNLFEEAKVKCLAKSKLKKPKLMAEPTEFFQNIVVIIKGSYPQQSKVKVMSVDICLYNKKRKDTEVKEVFDVSACSISHDKDNKFFNYKKYSEDVTIAIEEGENETTCSGSYALKAYLYEIENGEYIDGLVMQRDGCVNSIEIKNLDREKAKEIIVNTSTTGSSRYYKIDVFKFISNRLILDKKLSKKLTEEANIN